MDEAGDAAWPHRDECSIVGIGSSTFSSESGRSEQSLAVEASLAALDDAGLTPGDVDGVVRMNLERVLHNDLAHALGISELSYWGETGMGGGAPCGMLGQAIAAVVAGQATAVLVFRSLNGRSAYRFGSLDDTLANVGDDATYEEMFVPFGLTSPGQVWATMAQRHMFEYGTTSDQLGAIAMACRAHANANPAAQMYDRTMSLDDYRAARVISQPLRLFDYALETDGACAFIVTSTERARDCRSQPVRVRAVAQGSSPGVQPGIVAPTLMRTDPMTLPSAYVADRLYRRAGLGPADIDVAQFYDCFTPTVLFQLEDYGFCDKGEGGPYAASGAISPGGSCPINTAGGNLSEGYIQGVNHIVEGVRQMRGTSTSQVDGAEVCLVTSGLPISTSAAILTK